nr:unnamed protein product [Leishmania braziliensis]
MFSTDTLSQFVDVLQCCSTQDAACHNPILLVRREGATVTQMSDKLLLWLPSNVAAHLRSELFLSDSAEVASLQRCPAFSKELRLLRSAAAECDTGPETTAASESQRASIVAGSREDESLRVRATTATAALAVLSVALWPLVQDPQAAISTTSSFPEASAVFRVECVCAVLLRLVTSNFDRLHGTWAAHELVPAPSLISMSTVRPHVVASLKKWMQYFLAFFMDWVHRLQSSVTPMPGISRLSTKQRRAAAAAAVASHLQTAKSVAECTRNGGPHRYRRGQPTLLPGPLRGCPVDFVRHPLHYYVQALQRAVAMIQSKPGATPSLCSDGDDHEPCVAPELCAEHHRRGSCASAAVCARRRHGAPLAPWGMARRRRVEARDSSRSSSKSSSNRAMSSSPTGSPLLFHAFLSQHQRRAPVARLPKRHAPDRFGASTDDDVPLVVLAERLRARTLE